MKTEDLPRLEPGDAAWLLVLLQNAVPCDRRLGSPSNWEGKGRQAAYELLANAAGATPRNCGAGGCPLGGGHGGECVNPIVDAVDAVDAARISAAVAQATARPSQTVYVEGDPR